MKGFENVDIKLVSSITSKMDLTSPNPFVSVKIETSYGSSWITSKTDLTSPSHEFPLI